MKNLNSGVEPHQEYTPIPARELRDFADRLARGESIPIHGCLLLRRSAFTIDKLQEALNKANFDAAELRGKLAQPTLLDLVPRKDLKAVEEERDNLRHEVDQMAAEIRRRPAIKGVTLDVPPGTRIAIELP